MEAKEFKIGNWVNEIRCDGKLYPSQITHIQTHEGSSKIKCNGWFADSPIQLTEEWFVKFGFYKKSNDCVYSKESLEDQFNIMHNSFHGFKLSMDGCFVFSEIKYVHQLQNLYFALTGEELTFKTDV